MIKKIYASDKRFKTIELQQGLNIILAERAVEATKKDTRNGSGKTTLVNIIHFCLGCDIKSVKLPIQDIEEWSFFIDIEICGKHITAKRSIKKHNYIVVTGDTTDLPLVPEKSAKSNELFYKNDDWKKLLGLSFFNLQDDPNTKYKPSFRSLISYFIRRDINAYSSPFIHFRNQKTYDLQINNAYLLGLNWKLASDAQVIRDNASSLKALNTAIKSGMSHTEGELEAERVRLEIMIAEKTKAINTFKVLPQYKELQEKADSLTIEIHQRSNTLLLLRRKLTRYEDSIKNETAPEKDSVEKLYAEAGFLFSESIKKTLDEAKKFHSSIVENRKNFLLAEITEIKHQIANIETKISSCNEERANLMAILETHGALEEFSLLQAKVTEKQKRLENIKTKLKELKEISNKQKEIKEQKIELESRIKRDYDLDRPNWEKAVALFNESSLALYNEPGNLIINTSDKGYDFNVEIQRSGSEGVGKMKIFCYDMTLVELFSEKDEIDFLIHDSTIFDGVDSRQRANALQYACKSAYDHSFQYICILNSDMVPYNDFEDGFEINNFVRLKLGDQNPSESLMGFHFELKDETK